jgi:sulfatase maturation enzyme AslB (radical SAM superfamily)
MYTKMRESLYWDAFSKRIDVTIDRLKNNKPVPIERVAVFITDKCNLRCAYCNSKNNHSEMSQQTFEGILKEHPEAIIHISGGEPSLVSWLYPYLVNHPWYRFHLNTNAILPVPAAAVKRLKVSLDSSDSIYWNKLVQRNNAFQLVVQNIKQALDKTVVSITYTITRENYLQIPEFIKFCNKEFQGLYAIFFSVYKGTNPTFMMTEEIAQDFFTNIKPIMDATLDTESRALLNETIDEKMRLMQGKRFPKNNEGICYISLSEIVYRWDGTKSACSHLFRDGILNEHGQKNTKCEYGCNRRLVEFNTVVENKLGLDSPESIRI